MSVSQLISLTGLELTRFFFAIVLLLISAHWFGYFFHRFKMPRVIGEIVGGLILGPTILGFIFPGAYAWIFNAFEAEGKLISSISWIGLVLLMFIAGFEVQRSLTKGDKKLIIALLVGATIIPFIIGWFAPNFVDFSRFLGDKNNMFAFKIVIAIAVAVTSIPVISKIFIDLGLIKTRFAKIVLAVATIEDIILWVALAIATGVISSGNASLPTIVITILITIGFFAVNLLLIPKLVQFGNNFRFNLLIKSSVSGYTLFICFFFAALASLLNVNIIFGAFLAGIVIGSLPDKRFEPVKKYIKEVSLGFFIPIYFAVVGIKLDLIHNFDILFFLGFMLFVINVKTICTLIAAKFMKNNWLSSFNFAVAMNARGGPGIVLATVAFDLGIINETFFAILVVVAMITSLIAGYWFNYLTSKKLKLLS